MLSKGDLLFSQASSATDESVSSMDASNIKINESASSMDASNIKINESIATIKSYLKGDYLQVSVSTGENVEALKRAIVDLAAASQPVRVEVVGETEDDTEEPPPPRLLPTLM